MYYRYSICIKEKVVQEVSEGSSISEVCRRYDIKGAATLFFLKIGQKNYNIDLIFFKKREVVQILSFNSVKFSFESSCNFRFNISCPSWNYRLCEFYVID
jgi:hypothetical protein